MRTCLISHDIGAHATAVNFREDIRCIAKKPDRLSLSGLCPAFDHRQRLIKAVSPFVHIACAKTEIDAIRVAFDRKAAGPCHYRGQRLCAAHAAQPSGQDPSAFKIASVMLATSLGEGLVSALHNPLCANINPRAGGHLAVHHQALLIELIEMIPIRPVRHDVRVGDQNTRRICMGLHDGNRLTRLHDQRLVRFEVFQTRNHPVEIIPCPCRPPDAAIDHKFMRILSHFRMQIVHQHAHRSLGEPAFRRDLGACWRIDVSNVVTQIIHTGLQRINSSRTSLRCGRRRAAICVS